MKTNYFHKNISTIEKKEFWQNLLADFLEPTQLSIPRKSKNSIYKQIDIKISKHKTKQLDKFIQLYNLTLIDLMHAAWAVLLSKYSNTDNVIFGIYYNAQKVLPLRIQINNSLTFSGLLRHIKKLHQQLFKFGDINLQQIKTWLNLKNINLFSSMVNNTSSRFKNSGRKNINPPILFNFYKQKDNIYFCICYCSYDDKIIHQATSHLKNILIRSINNPYEKVIHISPLADNELHKLLHIWNDTSFDYPVDNTIHELFEEQVRKTPDNIAVIFEDKKLSYQELNNKANQLAHYLRTIYLEKFCKPLLPDTFIAICTERSLEMIIGILGILKAGGAYIPLDIDYPKDRLRFILQDTGVKLILVKQSIFKKLPFLSSKLRKIIFLDNEWRKIEKSSTKNLNAFNRHNNIAYVIYTSGSTGLPKGVVIRHNSVVNVIDWVNKTFHITVNDRILFVSSLCFDLSVYDIFGILIAGGSIRIATKCELDNPTKLLQVLCNEKITFWDSAPAHLQQLEPLFSTICFKESALNSKLRLVFLSGDWIPICLVKNIKKYFPKSQIISLGGATEATIWSNFYPIYHISSLWKSIPYGKPIQNMQYFVLNKHKQVVPIGIPGELYIGGIGLAKCYLNRVKLTKEKFVQNPFNLNKKARLYKTGDMVRWLANGNLEFLGRIDKQVKIRGFRIELDEIESQLAKISVISQCAVTFCGDEINKQLVAYYVCKPNKYISSHELYSILSKKLANYMTPSAFVQLSNFPLNLNGKIDRDKLRNSTQYNYIYDKYLEPPRTAEEESLVRIWCKVLQLKRIGINNDFFSVGGNSLNAMQLIFHINKKFNVALSLSTLFNYPTIKELSNLLFVNNKNNLYHEIKKTKTKTFFPLSYAQEQIWLHQKLANGVPLFNEVFMINIDHSINIAILEDSINQIVKKHKMLRANFIFNNDLPKQKIATFKKFPLPTICLIHLKSKEKERYLIKIANKESIKPFDLTSDRLIRFLLMQLNKTQYKLFIVAHHIIIDAISIFNIFMQELELFYKNLTKGRSLSTHNHSIQYKDFAIWEKNFLLDSLETAHFHYWASKLEKLPVLQLPTKNNNLFSMNFYGDRVFSIFPYKLVDALEKLSKQNKVTLFMTLLTAFKVLLMYYTQHTDIIVGTIVHGRNRPELDKIIGNFLNTIILRSNLSYCTDFQQALEIIKTSTLEAYKYQSLPFQKILQLSNSKIRSNKKFPFQVAFVYEPYLFHSELGWSINQLEAHTGTSKFDLTFELDKRSDGMIIRIEYNTELFQKDTINRMLKHYELLLNKIIRTKLSLHQLCLLTEAERQKLLLDWNNRNAKNIPKNKIIYELFEEQAHTTPNDIAIIYEDQILTYKELNQKANQLANYLRKFYLDNFNKHLIPDTIIGICFEPGLNIIISILAILKSGAAYVPIDSNTPLDRLKFIQKNSVIKIILTQKDTFPKLLALFEDRSKVICLEDSWQQIRKSSSRNPKIINKPDNIAYTIYTSASSGKPKGVLISHYNLIRLFQSTKKLFHFNRNDIWTLFHSIAFDFSIWEIFGALLHGGKLVIVPPNIKKSPENFYRFLIQNKVTILNQTPFAFRQLAKHLLQSNIENSKLALRYIIFGGDVLEPDVFHGWFQKFTEDKPQLINMYGITETTVHATYQAIKKKHIRKNATIPIGKPLPDLKVYILNKYLQPLPIGVPGELHIGGAGLARGYLNQPELTKEKFIKNPFSKDKGARLYKTGDLARWLPDGNIEFIGRIDDQVKIRGFRIELEEVNTHLSKCTGVMQSIVLAKEDDAGSKYLAAYVVGKVDLAKIHTQLAKFLPDYMVPEQFFILDSFPVNANGKIDRQALLELKSGIVEETKAVDSKLEEDISNVFRKLLEKDNLDVQRNFFEMGVHSFMIIRACSLLNEKIHTELQPIDLFTYSNIRALANFIAQSTEDSLFDSVRDKIQEKKLRMASRRKHKYGDGGAK